MTPPQPQPAQQHCDHECVCEWWRGNPSREPCCPVGSKCEHDTRTHPHTSQPVPEKCCIGLTYEQCQEVSEREKAATRNATLDDIENAIMKKEEWTRMELLAIIGYNRTNRGYVP